MRTTPRLSALVGLVAMAGLLTTSAAAQELTGTLRLSVAPDKPSWTYGVGEPVTFLVDVTRDGHRVEGLTLQYQAGPEMLAPTIDRQVTSEPDALRLDGGTMQQPGFLRAVVTLAHEGRTYRAVATAGFDPHRIEPTVANPNDFDPFWDAGKAALANIPLSATREDLPTYSTPDTRVSHVSIQTVGVGPDSRSRVYGILCEPRDEGRYPALLVVPGAGIRPYRGEIAPCQQGIITLQIGIHGMPVTLDPEVYSSLGAAGLSRYMTFNLDDRDRYYYRRVYLSTVRANDFLTSLPNWDGSNLGVIGGSQGGALAIVTAALDPRVRGLAASYPALSDTTGYLHDRAGGWPHLFHPTRPGAGPTDEKLATLPYFDVVNFARRLKVPGIYTWGYNDEVCPPTSMHAAYNVITAPKVWLLALETAHGRTPEQVARMDRWMEDLLKSGRAPTRAPAPTP